MDPKTNLGVFHSEHTQLSSFRTYGVVMKASKEDWGVEGLIPVNHRAKSEKSDYVNLVGKITRGGQNIVMKSQTT